MWDVTAEGLVYDMFSEEFLLTHPVWDVTSYEETSEKYEGDFYSHIPCGM